MEMDFLLFPPGRAGLAYEMFVFVLGVLFYFNKACCGVIVEQTAQCNTTRLVFGFCPHADTLEGFIQFQILSS